MVVLLGLKDVKYIRCTLSSWGKQEFDREQWAGETKRGLFARVLEIGLRGCVPETRVLVLYLRHAVKGSRVC